MSKPIEILSRDVRIVGLAWGNARLEAEIPSGKGTRTVEVTVDAERILHLADCIRGCQQVYEDPATGEKPKSIKHALADERFKPTWIGHAVWHMDNPNKLMPCLPHGSEVIDAKSVEVLQSAGTARALSDGRLAVLPTESEAKREAVRMTARMLGWDCQTNGGHFEEYRDQIAAKYGVDSWDGLPKDLRNEAFREFVAGKKEERDSSK